MFQNLNTTDNAAMIGIVGYQKIYHNNLKLL
jgi:tRNA A37 threonylcarbamoyltransferase TsaD